MADRARDHMVKEAFGQVVHTFVNDSYNENEYVSCLQDLIEMLTEEIKIARFELEGE